jgi:hypothetical protein
VPDAPNGTSLLRQTAGAGRCTDQTARSRSGAPRIFGYGLLRLLFGPKDFHTWGRSEDLAEVVHPVPSIFG